MIGPLQRHETFFGVPTTEWTIVAEQLRVPMGRGDCWDYWDVYLLHKSGAVVAGALRIDLRDVPAEQARLEKALDWPTPGRREPVAAVSTYEAPSGPPGNQNAS